MSKIHQPPMAKLPVERLLERVGCGPTELARRLGVNPRVVNRAQVGGGIHCWTADRWAVKLGWHPAEVWGATWWHLACDSQDAWDARLAREKAESEARSAHRKRLIGMFGDEWRGKFCGRHPQWSTTEAW